jgi:MoaA/NifB/PqqE/SkfB family radical SAM enzyme
MHMLATGKCHARCIMCGIWKTGLEKRPDLTLEQWDRVFADRLFSKLEFAGISGGESFLRPDLPDLLVSLHRHATRLKRLSITTSGTVPYLMEKTLERLIPYCRENQLLLDISVSKHGLGEVFERITGVPKASEKALKAFDILKSHRVKGELTMSINAVLLRENLDQARELAAWAREQDIPISFVIGEQRARFHNQELSDAFVPDSDRGKLLAFLREMGGDLSVQKLHSLRYRDLVLMMEKGTRRTLPCYYALGGFVLGHDAQLYYCSHSRPIGNGFDRSAYDIYYDPANLVYRKQDLLGRECAMCPPYTLTRWEIEVYAHKVVAELIKEKMRRPRA